MSLQHKGQTIVFQVSGGIGKTVASTAVIAAIKKQYPDSKIVIMTGNLDVYTLNKKVDEAPRSSGFSAGNPEVRMNSFSKGIYLTKLNELMKFLAAFFFI